MTTPSTQHSKGLIIWITGQPSSGKTTLAQLLVKSLGNSHLPIEWIDGDKLREETQNFDYTTKGRSLNIRTAVARATSHAAKGGVSIISMVSSVSIERDKIRNNRSCFMVYLRSTRRLRPCVADYQPPISPDLEIDTDQNDSITTFTLVFKGLCQRLFKLTDEIRIMRTNSTKN
jgi:energy-coupling factor transporter ATP-binding protein EcfA2